MEVHLGREANYDRRGKQASCQIRALMTRWRPGGSSDDERGADLCRCVHQFSIAGPQLNQQVGGPRLSSNDGQLSADYSRSDSRRPLHRTGASWPLSGTQATRIRPHLYSPPSLVTLFPRESTRWAELTTKLSRKTQNITDLPDKSLTLFRRT